MSFLTTSSRPSLQTSANTFICKTCRRTEATYRRTRKALRVHQNPALAPSTTETTDHIIFNPPSSAPNVYHTPTKFLPKTDPRRAALLHTSAPQQPQQQGVLATLAAQRTTNAASLKPIRRTQEQKYHLSQEQIEEIRTLRKQDPRQWTRKRLAERYECSQFFVSLICSAPEVAKEKEEEDERARARWGHKRKEAREGRTERKKLWGRDA